jgi:hypothetical protein
VGEGDGEDVGDGDASVSVVAFFLAEGDGEASVLEVFFLGDGDASASEVFFLVDVVLVVVDFFFAVEVVECVVAGVVVSFFEAQETTKATPKRMVMRERTDFFIGFG